MLSLNVVGVLAFIIIFFGYHGVYFYITDRYPNKTTKGRMNPAIESWLTETLEEEDHLLIVHQLRNQIMAVTFLATTSVLLLGLMINSIGIREIVDLPSGISPGDYTTWTIIVALGFSLLNSMLSLRYFTNLTILIKSSPDKIPEIKGTELIDYLKDRYQSGNREYLMARRGLLYGIITLTWYLDLWIYIALLIISTTWFAIKHDR